MRAVDPGRLLARRLRLDRTGRRLEIDLEGQTLARPPSRIWIAGAGKAALSMAVALDEIAPGLPGILVAPSASIPAGGRRVGRLLVLPADHPVPGAASLRSTRRLIEALARRPQTDTVLMLLSGGASALLVAPARGLTLADKAKTVGELLRCGADIHEFNTVRKHLSAIKGGGLLRLAAPREVLTLAISDVPGDELATIGSGPSVPDPTTFADAWRVLEERGIAQRVPAAVRRRLHAGREGARGAPETVKPGDRLAARARASVIGSNATALRAAAAEARSRGYAVVRRRFALRGEASECGRSLAAALRQVERDGRPICVLAGGETSVTLGPRPGRGGRNQELALAAAIELAGTSWALLAAGTDGIDGVTEAAGAFCDGTTLRRNGGRETASRFLARHDSHGYFRRLGDLLVVGPTGTNVMDIAIALRRLP